MALEAGSTEQAYMAQDGAQGEVIVVEDDLHHGPRSGSERAARHKPAHPA
jgi:hypothetical protein